MNGIDDLRATLEREAGRLTDHALTDRPGAVRRRVRVIRRRRQAVGAVSLAAVLAVVGVGAGTGLLRTTDNAQPAVRPTEVAGVSVPATVMVLDFEYTRTQVVDVTGDQPLDLALPASDRRRVVSLVGSDLGGATATVSQNDELLDRITADGVTPPVPVLGPDATSLVVDTSDLPDGAEVGLAIYEVTGLPAGPHHGTDAVFRQIVGDAVLQAGAFAPDGEAEVSLAVDGASDDLSFATYCSTTEEDLWLHEVLDGGFSTQGLCGDDAEYAADGGAIGSFSQGGSVPRERELRWYVTRGQDGPLATGADVVLGGAVYERLGEGRRHLGLHVPGVVEVDGQTWLLESLRTPDPGATSVSAEIDTSDGPRVVGFIANGRVQTFEGRSELGDSFTTRYGGAGVGRSAGSSIGERLLPGDRYTVTIRDGRGEPSFDGMLLVYRPASMGAPPASDHPRAEPVESPAGRAGSSGAGPRRVGAP